MSFYNDLNSIVTERGYESSDMLYASLEDFLTQQEGKMQNEVLETDKLENRLGHLEEVLLEIKELKAKSEVDEGDMVYQKALQIDTDGMTMEILASVQHDLPLAENKDGSSMAAPS